jgi:hypothetical protein
MLDILHPYNSIFPHPDPFIFSIRISWCFVGVRNLEPREKKILGYNTFILLDFNPVLIPQNSL